MASQDEGSEPYSTQFEEKYNLLLEKHLRLRKKYIDLALKHNYDTSGDSQSYEPPAKKRKMINMDDPFEFLPPELGDEILKHLTPIELLKAMEVSKSWCNFIKSSENRMSRVMEKVVAKFNSNEVGKLKGKTLHPSLASGRDYKHIEADFGFHLEGHFAFPLIDYASSLETLKLTYHCRDNDLKPSPVNFTKLRSLTIQCFFECTCSVTTIIKFIEASSFPEVTNLIIDSFDDVKHKTLNKLLPKFPKLKAFAAELHVTENPSTLSYETFEGQPKIEIMWVDAFYNELLNGFKENLTELCVEECYSGDVATLLGNLKKLQTLVINTLNISLDGEEFPQNVSVQTLGIWQLLNDEDGGDLGELYGILQALPALVELKFDDEVSVELIRILATNLRVLKKLTYSSAADAAMEFYSSLKDNEHQFVNTTFELVHATSSKNFAEQFKEEKFN